MKSIRDIVSEAAGTGEWFSIRTVQKVRPDINRRDFEDAIEYLEMSRIKFETDPKKGFKVDCNICLLNLTHAFAAKGK